MCCSTRSSQGSNESMPRDVLVDAVARVEAAQRRVGKIPLPGVEAESLVDHHRLIARTSRLDEKNACRPLVLQVHLSKTSMPGEIREILDLAQLLVGQKIVHRQPRRIARDTASRTVCPARTASCPMPSCITRSAVSSISSRRTSTTSSAARATPDAPPALFQAFRSPESAHVGDCFGI